MGLLPLQFLPASPWRPWADGPRDVRDRRRRDALTPRGTVAVKATAGDGSVKPFDARVRIDTPEELVAFRNGGILPYVLRQLLRKK